MNIFTEIFNLAGNVLYMTYDMLLLGGILLVFPLDSIENNMILHTKCINICNNYCKDICYDVSWKTCQVIAAIEIFNKKTAIPSFHKLTNNYFRNRNAVLVIKNGDQLNQFKTWELFESAKEKEDIEYDLFLYTKYSETDSKKNYTVIGDQCLKNPDEACNHICDVNFIIFQLTTDNNKYDINLKEPRNFFVKNNTLKITFFKWYMKTVYNVLLTEEFSINYMTQDMSIANLHNPFYIKFNEDSITSFSTGKSLLKPTPTPVSITKPILTIDIPEYTTETIDEAYNSDISIEDYQDRDDIVKRKNNLYRTIINNELLKEQCEQ